MAAQEGHDGKRGNKNMVYATRPQKIETVESIEGGLWHDRSEPPKVNGWYEYAYPCYITDERVTVYGLGTALFRNGKWSFGDGVWMDTAVKYWTGHLKEFLAWRTEPDGSS